MKRIRISTVFACLVLTTCLAVARDAVSEPAVEQPAAAVAEAFDANAATRGYMARLSDEQLERSADYMDGGYWLRLWGFLYGLGVAWLLLGSGLSRRMRDLAERVTRRKPIHTALYAVQYVLLTGILSFPLTVYRDFFREHKYGLATQTFGPWFGEQLIGLGVGVVLMSLLLVVLYGVFRKATKSWWLWGSGVGVVFLCFVMLIAPVYIDPLFNTYTPIDDPEIAEPVLAMARANGVEVDRLYQYDASRQTTRISAHVTGFLGTKQIRLNDNLLERCTVEEIRAVTAHELGHYVLNHTYEGLMFFGIVLVVGFAFIRWSYDRVLARWGAGWGVRGIGDTAGYPLLVALISIYFLAMTPVVNNFIRVNEAEADIYGLNAAREPEGFAEAALKLVEYRKVDPGPVEEFLLFDHPSGRTRIEMAMRWKAENVGAD